MRFISSESPAALFPCGRLFWFLEDGGHAMAAAPLPLQSPCVLLFRIRAHGSDQAFSSVTVSQECLACLGGLSVPRPSLVFCRIRMCARADPLLNTGACAGRRTADAHPPTRTRRTPAPGWRPAFAVRWPSARAWWGFEFSTVVIPAGVHVVLQAALSVPSGKLASRMSWVSTGET